MPVVRAGDIPYNAAPTQVPDTSLPGTGGYQRIRASPEDFGWLEGVANTQLGKDFERFGNVMAENAIAKQQLINRTTADDATNKYQEQITNLLYGTGENGDVGLLGKQGKDYMDALPGVRNQIIGLRNTMRGALANDQQRLLFDGETRRAQLQFLQHMGARYDTELKNYSINTSKAGIDLAHKSMDSSLAQGNDGEFEAQVGKAMRKRLDILNQQGLGQNQDAVDNALAEERAYAVDRKTRSLAETDPNAALQFLENNKDAVPKDYYTLKEHLQNRAKQNTADGDAFEALGLVPPGSRSGGGPRPAGSHGGDPVEQFLDLAEHHESRGRNIMQNVVPAGGGYNPSTGTVTEGSTAQGYFQITNTTWRNFAPGAGIQLGIYPNAMSAPYEVQRRVARYIATTDGVQHWTDWNKNLRAAVQDAGLPTHGPIQGKDVPETEKEPDTGPIQYKQIKGVPEGSSSYIGGKPRVIAFGDSIGRGVNRNAEGFSGTTVEEKTDPGGLDADAAGSRNPKEVFEAAVRKVNGDPARGIPAQPDYFSGATVVLSSGTMNDRNGQMHDYIPKTVAFIKDHGGSVVLMGADVGKYASRESVLRQAATDNGVPYAGHLPTANVHPSPGGYKSYGAHALEIAHPASATQSQQAAAEAQPDTAAVKVADNSGVVPIPPGQQAGQPGLVTPPNKSGLPPLEEAIKRILGRTDRTDQQKMDAITKTRQLYNDFESSAERQYRLHEQLTKAQDEAVAGQYVSRMAPDSPNPPTAAEIQNDNRLTTARRESLVRFLERPEKSDPPANVSAATRLDIFNRMLPQYQGQDKITSQQAIDDAFSSQKLTRNDYDWLTKHFADRKTGEGEKELKFATERANAFKHFVRDPNLDLSASGVVDENRWKNDVNELEFNDEVKSLVHDYMVNGKPLQDLTKRTDKNDPLSSPIGEIARKYKPQTPTSAKVEGPNTPKAVDMTQFSDDQMKALMYMGKLDRGAVIEELKRRHPDWRD